MTDKNPRILLQDSEKLVTGFVESCYKIPGNPITPPAFLTQWETDIRYIKTTGRFRKRGIRFRKRGIHFRNMSCHFSKRNGRFGDSKCNIPHAR